MPTAVQMLVSTFILEMGEGERSTCFGVDYEEKFSFKFKVGI
jgi:hypothetical protein